MAFWIHHFDSTLTAGFSVVNAFNFFVSKHSHLHVYAVHLDFRMLVSDQYLSCNLKMYAILDLFRKLIVELCFWVWRSSKRSSLKIVPFAYSSVHAEDADVGNFCSIQEARNLECGFMLLKQGECNMAKMWSLLYAQIFVRESGQRDISELCWPAKSGSDLLVLSCSLFWDVQPSPNRQLHKTG